MSAAASINFWGVLAALSFAGMMGMILWRMLRVSRALRIVVARIPGFPRGFCCPFRTPLLHSEDEAIPMMIYLTVAIVFFFVCLPVRGPGPTGMVLIPGSSG
jgi:hypothetical protein